MADPTAQLPHSHFRPRPLDNLAIADEVESLDPILDSKVMNILPNSDTPQILAACGRGARSSFRMLRHGLDVEESVSSELPGIPNAVWTTKQREEGAYLLMSTNYIEFTPSQTSLIHILSFLSSTAHWYCLLARQSKKFRILASSHQLQLSQYNKLEQTPFSKSTLMGFGMSWLIDVSTNGAFLNVGPLLQQRRTSAKWSSR